MMGLAESTHNKLYARGAWQFIGMHSGRTSPDASRRGHPMLFCCHPHQRVFVIGQPSPIWQVSHLHISEGHGDPFSHLGCIIDAVFYMVGRYFYLYWEGGIQSLYSLNHAGLLHGEGQV